MFKVLAVEDNPAILDFYREFFGDFGFEVRTADDAMSAVAVYREFRPDLVVLDLGIPAGGGQLVFETIRSKFNDPVPVIFSTGQPEKLPHSLKHLHKVAVLVKPVAPEALLAEVRRLLPGPVGAAPGQSAPSQVPAPPPPPRPEQLRRRLLIVDDDPVILELYRELLAGAGFETACAEDAAAAVTLFQEFHPALVILDVDMPAGGGRKVFERLRLQLASPAPVLFSTASPEAVSDLLKNRSVAVLKKPVQPGALLKAVRELLGG